MPPTYFVNLLKIGGLNSYITYIAVSAMVSKSFSQTKAVLRKSELRIDEANDRKKGNVLCQPF